MQESFGNKLKEVLLRRKNTKDDHEDLPLDDGYNKIPVKGKLSLVLKILVAVGIIIGIIVILIIINLFVGRGLKDIEVISPPVIYVSEEYKITATAIGKGNLKKTLFKFELANSNLASFSKSLITGSKVETIIKGLQPGNTTLSVNAITSDGKSQGNEQVNLVVCGRIKSNLITVKTIRLNVGESKKIDLGVGDSYECLTAINYKFEDDNIATLSDDLTITGYNQGTTNLALDDGISMIVYNVVVQAATNKILITSLGLSESSFSLKIGETKQIGVTITPSNATNKTISWISMNTDVATVDNNGLITAKSAGIAIVNATTTDGTDLVKKITVTVIK